MAGLWRAAVRVALWLLKEEKLAGLQMAGTAKQFGYPFGLVRKEHRA